MFKTMSADQVGYMKFAIGGISTVVVGTAIWILNGLRPVLDDNLCVVNQVVAGHTVLVADISETEDATTLPDVIRATAERLPQYHRLSVYRIADLHDTPTDEERAQGLWPLVRVFSACNPGRGDEVNPLLVGARFAEKRYKNKFSAPLDEMIKATAERAGSETSPILTALAQLPKVPEFDGGIPNKTLVVRSDLLQHTPPLYSHYAHDIKDLDFALRQVGAAIPRLDDVAVNVAFVQRPRVAGRQTAEHREFWRAYFARAGRPQALTPVAEPNNGNGPRLVARTAVN